MSGSWSPRFRRHHRKPRRSGRQIQARRRLRPDLMTEVVAGPQSASPVRLGLKENWPQFTLLVLINAFVGGMVGMERTVVPLIGAEEFKIVRRRSSFRSSSASASSRRAPIWSPAISPTLGARKRVLVLGWLVGLPVPFMIMWAPSWGWVIAANALLGINQGFAWSMTVIMKIDLVGPKSRGLAVGLNEFAGYLAVGVTAFLTGYLASTLRPAPGAVLSRRRLRRLRRRALDPSGARHARARPARDAQRMRRQASPISFREIFVAHVVPRSQSVRRVAGRARQQSQ